MVAGVLYELGLYMGDEIDFSVYEDPQLGVAIESNEYSLVEQLCRRRDLEYRRWGLKRPFVYRNVDSLLKVCTNPRLIVLFRDVLAVAVRNNIAVQQDVLETAKETAQEYEALMGTLADLTCPTLLLSYEKCLQHPQRFVEMVSTFCGLIPNEFQTYRALGMIENGRPEYTRAARLKYNGSVDRVFGRALNGWVVVVDEPGNKPEVVLYVDGEKIGKTRANRYRRDLASSSSANGICGFEFELPERLRGEEVVHVRIANSFITVPNSGRTISSLRSDVAPFSMAKEGNIDGVYGRYLWGWAYLKENLAGVSEVELYLDDRPVGTSALRHYRPDVARLNINGGWCGFQFEVPPDVSGSEIVTVRIGISFLAVPNSGRPLSEYRTTSAPRHRLDHAAIDGVFERLLWGWVYIEGREPGDCELVVYLDGREVGRALADRPRSDLAKSGYGDGNCGFEFELPAGLTGEETLDVRLPNSFATLSNSGRPLSEYRTTSAPRHRLDHAAIDGVFERLLWGWVYIEGREPGDCELVVYLDGREVGRALADRPRSDLAKSGYGDGNCGFEFELPAGLTGEETLDVRLPNSFATLSNSGRPLSEYRTTSAPRHRLDHAAIDGVFERLLWGWVYIEGREPGDCELVVYLDGREVGRALADRPRSDLAKSGYGDGNCGFEFELPAGLTGEETLDVRLPNSFATLSNSGRPLSEYQAGEPRYQRHDRGHIDEIVGHTLRGWAYVEDAAEICPEVIVYLDGKEVGRELANRSRPDVAAAGCGNGKCGFEFKLPDGVTGSEILNVRLASRFSTIANSGRTLESYSEGNFGVVNQNA